MTLPDAVVGRVKVTGCCGTSGRPTRERGGQRRLPLLSAVEYPWWGQEQGVCFSGRAKGAGAC